MTLSRKSHLWRLSEIHDDDDDDVNTRTGGGLRIIPSGGGI